MRISPREVHINDPEYFNQLYSAASKLDKDWWYYRCVATFLDTSFVPIDKRLYSPWSPPDSSEAKTPDSVQPTQTYIVLDEKPCRGSSPNPPSQVLKNLLTNACNVSVSE